MKTHELARQLLALPDSDFVASIDIDTGEIDEHQDPIIKKAFADGICEVWSSRDNEVTILLENGEIEDE